MIPPLTAPPYALPDRTGIRALAELAIGGLERMQLDDGLFCEALIRGVQTPRGRSLRYSAMVLIGLRRAERAGYAHPFALDAAESRLTGQIGGRELRPGDYGLLLWLDAVSSGSRRDLLLTAIERALERRRLERLPGMQLAWLIQGLALHPGTPASAAAVHFLQAALDLACARCRSESGLFFHQAEGVRRRFANFATQSYLVMALATVATRRLDERALPAAQAAADRLLALQLPDGGWPWLYDAVTGRVVERYELYSVHQHGMAPMALLALEDATADRAYREATLRGLRWIHGANELGRDMVDDREQIVLRSIRRPRLIDPIALYGNTAAFVVRSRPLTGDAAKRVVVNPICCSYELGWLLEGWCGREGQAVPVA